jgi:hypothetical protein
MSVSRVVRLRLLLYNGLITDTAICLFAGCGFAILGVSTKG